MSDCHDEYDAIQAQIERAEKSRADWQAGIPLKYQLAFAAVMLIVAGVVMWLS